MEKIVSKTTPALVEEDGVKVGTFAISHQGDEDLAKMHNFQKNEELCDACLIAESDKTKIFAHILVLSVASEFFRSLFKPNREEFKLVAPLKDVSGKVLSQMVDFIYTGEIRLTEEDVEEFLKWSNVYRLQNLALVCEKFLILNINSTNLMKYKKIASIYDCELLKEEVHKFIDENFMDYHQTETLQLTGVDDLKQILSRSSLRCESEENVFDTVVHWLKFNPEERIQQIMELIPCIRFSFFPLKYILKRVDNFKGCGEAVFHCVKAMQWHTSSEEEKKTGEFCTTPRLYRATTAFQPLAWFGQGFFSYDVADKSWTKVYSTKNSIHFIFSRDGNKIIFVKESQGLEQFLIDLTDPSQTAKTIASPFYNGNKVYAFATCIVKNEIYLIGGWCKKNYPTNRVSVFNLITNEMKEIAPMKVARNLASAILFNNCIYVVGGYNGSKYLCDVEKFDIKTGEWSTMASPLHARRTSQCLISNQMLYVFGRNTKVVERYDFLKNEWSVVFSELPCEYADNAFVIEDEFFVTRQENSYRYDKNSATWVELAPLPDS